jgi:hypothetical protein
MESEFCQVDLHENSAIIEVMLFFIISKIEAAIELSSQDMLESGQFYQRPPRRAMMILRWVGAPSTEPP